MSSNDVNTHPDYDPNIRIKAEPETVSESIASASLMIPNLLKTIKAEPGLTSTTRLPSFRVPRDLTLGGHVKLERPKKVYTPNLNAQRIKNREDLSTTNKNESNSKTNRGRGRNERGRGERGRGRGKATSNLVQSAGIFSEGLADISTKRYSGGGIYRDRESSGGRETASSLERPKLSIPQKVDKAEEAEKLRALLRDDFVDDGQDVDLGNAPVALPMVFESKLFKTEPSPEITLPIENNEKSGILQNGEVKAQNNVKPAVAHTKTKESKVPLTVPQVLENKASTFILIQLPDCLPGLQSDEKQSDPKSKRSAETSVENRAENSNDYCTLNNLKEGMLGKLQILQSGKARLVLGDNNLIVDVGSNLSFRQDLITAKISNDKQSGDLINLGPVNSTLICSPDWESMLKKL